VDADVDPVEQRARDPAPIRFDLPRRASALPPLVSQESTDAPIQASHEKPFDRREVEFVRAQHSRDRTPGRGWVELPGHTDVRTTVICITSSTAAAQRSEARSTAFARSICVSVGLQATSV
jgi:hypothetical protein